MRQKLYGKQQILVPRVHHCPFLTNFVSDSDCAVSMELPEWKADCNYCSLEDILIETLLHVVEDFR